MNSDLDRIKNDLETMEKALGITTSMGRDWVRWMKRDQWIGLWWCLPGLILVVAAFLPFDRTQRVFGLVPDQWVGLLVAAVLLFLAAFLTRKVTAKDDRPDAFVREAKRMNGISRQGAWFNVALLVQLVLYFSWGWSYGISSGAFYSGLFLVTGSSCLVAALTAKAWPLLGWALPLLVYSLCLPLVEGHRQLGTILLGLMFISVALS